MILNPIFVTTAAMVLTMVLATGPGFAKESADARVLDKWLGVWKHHTVVRPAAWSLIGTELSGRSRVEWILNAHYQQVSSRNGEQETREIHRFDAKSGQYHKWAFDSDGGHSFWVGTWDEKTGTMTWKYMDFGLGIEGEIVNRFTGVGEFETTLVLKDGTGNVLLDIRSKHTRLDEQPD